jgi:crotonobetainyl-CoA:carnitine CoA-transferase CaiB-like acyl-CoA transferase
VTGLSGVRVVELGESIPAAYCGRQFARWGAGVVVLEGPEGSPLRRRAPFAGEPAVSLLWE